MPDTIVANCSHCHCQLPLGLEQSAWLAAGGRLWLFCPLCTRIVAAERVANSAACSAANPRYTGSLRDLSNSSLSGNR